jgi:hypothetical protein
MDTSLSPNENTQQGMDIVEAEHLRPQNQEGQQHPHRTNDDDARAAISLSLPLESHNCGFKRKRDDLSPSIDADALQRQLRAYKERLSWESELLRRARQQSCDLRKELGRRRSTVDKQRDIIQQLLDKEQSLKQQLNESKSEIERLREERSAQTSVIPVSTVTEDELLQRIRGINQKIIDLAYSLCSSGFTPPGEFDDNSSNSKKLKRFAIQGLICAGLYENVFGRFYPSLPHAQDMVLGNVFEKTIDNRQ